jgi:hypothetical protein
MWMLLQMLYLDDEERIHWLLQNVQHEIHLIDLVVDVDEPSDDDDGELEDRMDEQDNDAYHHLKQVEH